MNEKLARQFLQLLDPDAEASWHFRYIHPGTGESTSVSSAPQRKRNGELAPKSAGTTAASRLDAALLEVAEANAEGAGVFVVVNAGGGRDEAITRIRALYVDFDVAGDGHLDRLSRFGLPPSMLVESSPGKHHAYWLADDIPVAEFRRAQKRLIALLDTDKSVHNEARVMRVPGFMHTKGEPVMTRLLPGDVDVYSWAELAAELDKLPDVAVQKGQLAGGALGVSLVPALKAAGAYMEGRGEGGHEILCPWHQEHTDGGTSAGYLEPCEKFPPGGFHCFHSHCADRSLADLTAWLKNLNAPAEEVGALEDPIEQVMMQNPTQDNVALMFARRHAGQLIYVRTHNCWYEWDGVIWRKEVTNKAFEFARRLARVVNVKGKASLATAGFFGGVETICRADRAFARSSDDFNTATHLLNTPEGVIDLNTGEMTPNTPDNLFIAATRVAPVWGATEVFDQFLAQVTGGDVELQRFLQVSLGSILSGAIEEHWIMFWLGAGRNGKNTLGDLVAYVMGSYAKTIPTSTLMATRNPDHKTSIATLMGARLVVSSETSSGDFWDEAKVNSLTGDTTLSARFMGGDEFNFARTHKHLVFGNKQPQIRSANTAALLSRFKIVPFNTSFIGREDALLPSKLRAEGGGVLAWLLDGHRMWVENGRRLPTCAAVEAQTASYFEDQSNLDAWLLERVAKRVGARTGSSVLYNDYRNWRQQRGEMVESMTRWSQDMQSHFAKTMDGNGTRVFVNAELKTVIPIGVMPLQVVKKD